MSRFLTLILVVLMVFGTFTALIQLYASSDNLQHPFEASLFYLGTAFIMVLVIFRFRKETSKKHLIMNNFFISIFTFQSLIFALICLYALEPQSRVETLASSLFFFAGMIVSSSSFFVSPKLENSSTVLNQSENV
jgi:hypothetical protein